MTFVGFTVAVWFHAPEEVKSWVWVPIELLVFDRVARRAWATYASLSIFPPSTQQTSTLGESCLVHAIARQFYSHHGRESWRRWEPEQHMFIACQSIVPLQSHPFTISSLPSDGKMEFLARAEKGSTRRFFRYASKHDNVLGTGKTSPANQECTVTRKVLEKAEGESAVAVCGPEGLSDDVRRSLVALSDERAVHRGFIRMWNVLDGSGYSVDTLSVNIQLPK